LRKPFIYGDSLYRNYEMLTIRECLTCLLTYFENEASPLIENVLPDIKIEIPMPPVRKSIAS